MEVHRILSLDSGGVWAMLQVMALQKLFGPHARGHDVLKWFNLAAASGGGSVVLAGLAMNMTLQEILDTFFVMGANRQKIFGKPRTGFFKRGVRLQRHEALKDVLGAHHEKTLGDLARFVTENVKVGPQFLICAFDCDRRRPEFFRSDNHSRSASSTYTGDPPLLEVIHAATTSPLNNNENALAIIGGTRFCDGAAAGLYNPVVAAVTEAIANQIAEARIHVLSIGTGTVERPSDAKGLGGQRRDEESDLSSGMTHSAFNDPPNPATYIAHVMLGQSLPSPAFPPPIVNGTLVRMSSAIRLYSSRTKDKSVPKGGIDPATLSWLAAMDKGVVDQGNVDAVRKLGEAWLDDKVGNQPIRSNRNFECEIGHEKASGAIAQWKALAGEVTKRAA